MSAIAVVGMSCRFAGAEDLNAYWELMLSGRDSFGPIPAERWDNEAFYDENPRHADKSYVKIGAFLPDIQSFPALHFGMPPRRVEVMDPQQRLTLEMALQAIEDAGIRPELMPEQTGVFVGVTALEYRTLLGARITAQLMANGAFGRAPEDPSVIANAVENVVSSRPFTASGGISNMIAANVAQELNLHGPAWSVDAACTSSAIALTEAIRHLETGAVDAALAGGVYLNLTPSHQIVFTRLGAMSPDGTCRPFDHRASGFTQGEGAGMVLLKRLDDALRDGDRIYAVVRGYATNNDGKGTGPMAPVQEGQERVVRDAWRRTDLSPSELGYIEAHGTGTAVGDVIEFHGLVNTLGGEVREAAIGSCKANVGHTMSAAGVAGFIRTALSIYHAIIPPLAGYEAPKEELNLDATPFIIPTAAAPWTAPTRIAALSSFGFGGTNAHLILSDAQGAVSPAPRPHLVLMSAPDGEKLRHLARRTAEALRRDTTLTVPGVARAWAVRNALSERLAVVASTREELAQRLEDFANDSPGVGVYWGTFNGTPPKIAFLFPGQGSQRVGMLRDLLDRFPPLKRSLDALESALSDTLAIPLTHLLIPELRPEPVSEEVATEQLTDTAHTQPVLLAVGYALAKLLAEVGVRPHVVTGHSLGEFTAAAVAGVLAPEAAARFAGRRGSLMASLPGDHGAMAALMCDRDEAAEYLVDGAIIANFNHPRQVVVSGFTEAVAHVVRKAESAGVRTQALHVSHGFHSPALGSLDSAPLLAGISFADPQVPVLSAITARPYADAAEAREVFARHATSPVDFMNALLAAREEGADLYLQMGAGGPLAAFARGTLPRGHRGILTLASRDDRDEGRSLLETLGRLWIEGAPVDVLPITDAAAVATVPAAILPRERYWAVKEKRVSKVALHKGSAAKANAPRQEEAQREETAPQGEEVRDRVLKILSKVSSYPLHSLRPTQQLIDDLGFDSLMMGDLTAQLGDAFPQMGGIPQELLLNRPTVQDLIDFVGRASEAGTKGAADDEAPLVALQPIWVAAERPILSGITLSGRKIGAAGVALPGWEEAVRAVGAVVASADEAEVLLYADAAADARGDWPDLAGALIEVLRPHAGRRPSLAVLHRNGDVWGEALAGAARALAREWTEAKVISLGLDAFDDQSAATALAELASAETTPSRRIAGGVREVPGFAPAPVAQGRSLGPEDTALITGGAGEIGVALAGALARQGVKVLVVSRRAEIHPSLQGKVTHLRVDVTDRSALIAAVAPHAPVTAIIHAAGVLVDGPMEEISAEDGARVRAVKVAGWIHARAAAPEARVTLALGSWAGRFGNRHQVSYSAANALLAALAGAVLETGPWSSSAMTRSIPAAVQASMRASGVDFVGDTVGLAALQEALAVGGGVRTLGRRIPLLHREISWGETLSTETHPFLLDHAIEGTPVLPLASAADYLVRTAAPALPWALRDLKLYQGVAVKEPVQLHLSLRGTHAELRAGGRLAYDAHVEGAGDVAIPAARTGGSPSALSVAQFYAGVTFHGPVLQGIASIDAVGADFVRGTVRRGCPSRWTPSDARASFHLDALALDASMQLTAMVAYARFGRAGTPVSLRRFTQFRPLSEEIIHVEAHFSPEEGDVFSADVVWRDAAGELLAYAEGVVAELRKVNTPARELPTFKPEWVDFSKWKEVRDIEMRLKGLGLIGLRNPYFQEHSGTAGDTTQMAGREFINFSSYNYLGFSGDERVLEAVRDAVDRYGTSVSASRMASGERPFHKQLESKLAEAQGAEDALVFTAGHATNMNAIGHLFGPKDIVIHDEFIHDSILQGIKLAGAARRKFRHEDPADLEAQLQAVRGGFEKVLIVVEGAYSMDGDLCNLPAYIPIKKKYGCLLMVDEAHSFGIVGPTGRGIGEHHGLSGSEVDIWMGTLSKSLASCGGWLAGSKPLINYLRYTAPGFVYSAGLTPANGMAALKALEYMIEEPWRVEKLQQNAKIFHDALVAQGINTGPAKGGSGVVPAITGNSMHALVLSQRLGDVGVNVQPIIYPAVADDAARLRFFLSSTHREEQLVWTAEQVARLLGEIRAQYKV